MRAPNPNTIRAIETPKMLAGIKPSLSIEPSGENRETHTPILPSSAQKPAAQRSLRCDLVSGITIKADTVMMAIPAKVTIQYGVPGVGEPNDVSCSPSASSQSPQIVVNEASNRLSFLCAVMAIVCQN